MIILKEVKHDIATNSVEATWVERTTTPEVIVPEVVAPDTVDADGNVILGAVTPQHIIPAFDTDVQARCHSYADVQMDMLRADLGADAAAYADLIAEVEANTIPAPVPTEQELQAVVNATALAYLAATDWMAIRFSETGTPIPPDVLEARRAARDKVVQI